MIEIYRQVDTSRLAAWLETYVRSHLKPDVSNYARGRLRAWLGVEPSLTVDVRLKEGVYLHPSLKQRLEDLAGWSFDYALATYSGDALPVGIGAHRDARFADYEAVGLNVSGTCEFDYWEGRRAFSKAPNSREFKPDTDPPTHSLILKPGDVVRFNCKNLHRARPSTKRWNINLWRASQS